MTRWRQVADRIRAASADGTVGERPPPETELADRYAVNRHTVRRAIHSLADEGLLRSERGRGTFVNAPAAPVLSGRAPNPVLRERHGAGPEATRADEAVADMLDCPVSAPLFRLETLSVANGIPVSVSTIYLPAERFPSIVCDYAEAGSITEALKLHGLMDYRRRETRITAERLHPLDAGHLGTLLDSIVLVSVAVDVDAEDRPVQAMRSRFHADRMDLVLRP